jgi:hypothetical protein
MATTRTSPGISYSEIDNTAPVAASPAGIPAGIIGAANKGPAFVPVTVGSTRDFNAIFGDSSNGADSAIAAREYMSVPGTSVTFVRVLGAGDGKARNTSTGQVTNAGFVVGENLVGDNGFLGGNSYATAGGPEGRTYFLGCFMSESAGSSIFSSAGIQTDSRSVPIVRAILMAASGVAVTVSGSISGITNTVSLNAAAPGGSSVGSINVAANTFTVLLNGLKSSESNVITASFDTPESFVGAFNSDPLLLNEKGHYLYTYYDIPKSLAVVTSSGVIRNTFFTQAGAFEHAVFVATGSQARNASSTNAPNYENFRERFENARTPWITSQTFGGSRYDLFKIHALDDGDQSYNSIKVQIYNVTPSQDVNNLFGRFSLAVRNFSDADDSRPLEAYEGLSLDQSSERYIGRVIGDLRTFFDFDRAAAAQKINSTGDYEVRSPRIRVEISNDLLVGNVPDDALPFGFRGLGHIITSGSSPIAATPTGITNFFAVGSTDAFQKLVQPPFLFRPSLVVGTIASTRVSWGYMTDYYGTLAEPNSRAVYSPYSPSHLKFLPGMNLTYANFFVRDSNGAAASGGTVYDTDLFNNNLFSCERIRVATGSSTYADPLQWISASYVRNGSISIDDAAKTRALTINDLKNDANNIKFVKFNVPLVGGFNGTNIFDIQKYRLTNVAAAREVADSGQGGTLGPTVASYKKAIDVISNKTEADIQLLAVPGIRAPTITNYAISAVENRFDAMYIMDLEQKDENNAEITGSSTIVNLTNTVSAFRSRGLDSSFVATYFPDVNIFDGTTIRRTAPSVAVLGAFALNDSVAYPWFAPAGFVRGAMATVSSLSSDLTDADADTLYAVSINPILARRGSIVVFGQKTLQRAVTALDRVNVRRLLISMRRTVRQISNGFLFEPNNSDTLDNFRARVTSALSNIQQQRGVDRFTVVIDTSTTTQADIENNTIRGQIYLKPTRSVEFISLSFELNNVITA